MPADLRGNREIVNRSTSAWLAFGTILLFSVLVRLPFYFPAVLNWDESTFILVGQSLLDGHLPYVELWDVKPPLLFAFFAAALGLFGHSIAGVRLAGTLCVAVTAYFVFRITARWWGRPAGFFGAGLCVLGMSLVDSSQATMSEHVMLPAFTGAIYLWLNGRQSTARSFWMGILMATATLVRLNMVFAVTAVGLVMLRAAVRGRDGGPRNLAAYVAGGLSVVTATSLPYFLTGQLGLLWQSAVVGALARSTSENSAIGNLVGQLRSAFGVAPAGDVPWLISFLWMAGLAGLVALLLMWRHTDSTERRGVGLLAVLSVTTGLGIAMSGGGHAHYQIQLVPFAAAFAAALVRNRIRALRWDMWVVAVIATGLSASPIVTEYGRMLSRIWQRDGVRSGHVYDVAAWLLRENPDRRPVYMLTDHIVYWLNEWSPPSRMAHPSTVAKPDVLAVLGSTPDDELRRVFQQAPLFVVIHKQTWFLDATLDTLLQRFQKDDYSLAAEVHDRLIYRRSEPVTR